VGCKAAFDAVVRGFDGAMVVVTTAGGDERSGCLVGFHSQCSIEPRRYAVWLSKANHTYRLALLADHLAVHALGAGDDDMAARFGELTGDDVDKFAGVEWSAGPGGVPLLAALPHRFVGRKRTVLDDGSDHVCVVLEPVAADAPGGAPLAPLRLRDVQHLHPGHEAEERQRP